MKLKGSHFLSSFVLLYVKAIWLLFLSVYRASVIVLYSDQQMHTIISQVITLLHVSTLSCHPQGACNQYIAELNNISNAAVGNTITIKMFHTDFIQVLILYSLKSRYYQIFCSV
jgi:hypothetical protein